METAMREEVSFGAENKSTGFEAQEQVESRERFLCGLPRPVPIDRLAGAAAYSHQEQR
jgi:hypothetical protein